MYEWYGGSDICYAYLSDVNPPIGMAGDSVSFEKSRWFRRGWTG
jgi:hypothetical protein